MRNLLSIALVSFILYSCSAQTPTTTGYKVGDKAIDFSLKNIDGKMVSLKDFTDAKGFIVLFTCNHCPYSVAYEDRINDLNKKYAPKGYPVIAINPNDPSVFPTDSYDHMKKRSKQKKFTFPYLLDDTQEIAAAYGARRTPHVYLLDKEDDDLVVAYIGAIDNNTRSAKDADKKYVEMAIEALESGKKVDPDFTKAIGCTIKWRQL